MEAGILSETSVTIYETELSLPKDSNLHSVFVIVTDAKVSMILIAQHHKDKSAGGGTGSRVLELDAMSRWMVNFLSWSVYFRKKIPRYSLHRMFWEFQRRSQRREDKKSNCSQQATKRGRPHCFTNWSVRHPQSVIAVALANQTLPALVQLTNKSK